LPSADTALSRPLGSVLPGASEPGLFGGAFASGLPATGPAPNVVAGSCVPGRLLGAVRPVAGGAAGSPGCCAPVDGRLGRGPSSPLPRELGPPTATLPGRPGR